MMGELLTAMVGYDAFTQALTNPVLAPQVFTEATFTRAGMTIIRTTRSLQQILARNAADPAAAYCRFTYGQRRAVAPADPDAGHGPVRLLPPTGEPEHVRVKAGTRSAETLPCGAQSPRVRCRTSGTGTGRGGPCPSRISVPDDDLVPPEIVSTVFYSATVSDSLACSSPRPSAAEQRLTWCNEGAVQLLGYGLDDVRSIALDHLFPSLGGGELKLLLRRERAARMTLPVRTASGAVIEAARHDHARRPAAGCGRCASSRPSNEQERALRATADAHERRFSALTERSPIPTLLSEQGMRLAHVNDAFCTLVGLRAEQLLGTGWINTIHEDDLDGVIEQVAAALDGDEVEIQARLVRDDGAVRTTVIRFSHLFTPGVGAGFVGTIEDITDRLAFEAKLAHQANHDPLTGLPNRTLLAQYVAERFRPGAGGLACLFLDLDNFKVVNDSLGHTAGDELLVEVATPAARHRAPRRPGRPLRRRRVRRRLRERRRGRRRRAGRPRLGGAGPPDAPRRRGHPPLRQRRRHRADRRARRAPRSSSATATSRCTRRRPAARGGSPSSTSRPAPRPATSCGWSPSCATPSSAARSR